MPLQAGTYQNPVFPESFPDPFVLKFCGEYFAYCTGFARDGVAVGVARSRDLVAWEYLGGALQPLDSEPPYYWAPEVVYHNGRFYMYYSCGNETLMEIRVAVSDRPDGGFIDSGHRLTSEDFAIDAHVFTDDDGRRYMFYATDFLEHSHIGTGTVVDRMVSWFELEGDPKPVSRAAHDWQVYDPQRIEKGGVRWHTVEGPTVFKFRKKYFEMFSGGNWQNSSYGVAFAVSDSIVPPGEWTQSIDGVSVLPILRTIPERVIGPGHNSAAVGPNGRELFCVYHCWQQDQRVMAIDRMGFAGDRLFVNGPSFTAQASPLPPAATIHSPEWSFTGNWRVDGDSLIAPDEPGRADLPTGYPCFLAEFDFRMIDTDPRQAFITVGGFSGEAAAFRLTISPGTGTAAFLGAENVEIDLPETLDSAAFQHLRVEVDGTSLNVRLNGLPVKIRNAAELECDRLFIETAGAAAEIKGFALTPGFEDLFDRDGYSPEASGWHSSRTGGLHVRDKELIVESVDELVAWKGEAAASFEFIANLRNARPDDDGGEYGFAVVSAFGTVERRFLVQKLNGGYVLSDTSNGIYLPLPPSFRGDSHRQFRFLKLGSNLRIESENLILGEMEVDSSPAIAGIFVKGANVAVEMVRWTPLEYKEGSSV